MKNAYNKYMYLNKLEDMEEKINNTKRILNICYLNKNINYNDILKLSQYLDVIINKYYRLKKENEMIPELNVDGFLYYNNNKRIS